MKYENFSHLFISSMNILHGMGLSIRKDFQRKSCDQ
jgi:hypothetical protein